ncbi:hypothetical protein [Nocardia nova]|uniref:hypothetical protein n=1 Tax=Nocardia nova TaxID=37330 RepID=UPI000CEA04C9|nr:hypothetical protein [Nocardia nova]PPI94511.1 hypothetical protein C5E46_21480 [Nocardia nova]
MTTQGGGADETWTPWGLDEEEAAARTALDPTISAWLENSLWEWTLERLTRYTSNTVNGRIIRWNMEKIRRCERVLRLSDSGQFNEGPWTFEPAVRELRRTFGQPEKLAWQLVDFLLSSEGASQASVLDQILTEAGSAWTVGERQGKRGLVQRMPDGVVAAADEAFTHGDAGKRLASAWEAAFGVNPNPETAYSRAVKAVEDAAIPVVSPKNKAATLGTVISEIRSGGKFKLPHLREHPDAKTHDVLLSMLQMLWTGQHDRHGGPSSVSVPNVTQEEAETAVVLAVSLVGWFATGKVQK